MSRLLKEYDAMIKSLLAAAVVGLFIFCFNINSDVNLMKYQVKEATATNKQLIIAVQELRIAIEKLNKD